VGVQLRSAAAAAAEDKLVVEGCDFRNAWLAADWNIENSRVPYLQMGPVAAFDASRRVPATYA
jgi:hypothetical protein